MLIAKTESGDRIDAEQAEKGSEYFCQLCDCSVFLKRGEVRIPHFAHYLDANCQPWERETEEHIYMKRLMYEKIEKSNSVKMIEFEYPLYDEVGILVPDLYLELESGDKIAVECQASYKSIEEVLAKTLRYTKMDIYTLWTVLWNNILASKIPTSECSRIENLKGKGLIGRLTREFYKSFRVKVGRMERELYKLADQLLIIDNSDIGSVNLVPYGNSKTFFICDTVKLDRYIIDMNTYNPEVTQYLSTKDDEIRELFKPLVLQFKILNDNSITCDLKLAGLKNRKRNMNTAVEQNFCREVREAFSEGSLIIDIANNWSVSREEVVSCLELHKVI